MVYTMTLNPFRELQLNVIVYAICRYIEFYLVMLNVVSDCQIVVVTVERHTALWSCSPQAWGKP